MRRIVSTTVCLLIAISYSTALAGESLSEQRKSIIAKLTPVVGDEKAERFADTLAAIRDARLEAAKSKAGLRNRLERQPLLDFAKDLGTHPEQLLKRKGMVSLFPKWVLCRQVVSLDSVMVEAYSPAPRNAGPRRPNDPRTFVDFKEGRRFVIPAFDDNVALVEGIDTEGWTDRQEVSKKFENILFENVGTHTYATAAGGTNTVLRIRVFCHADDVNAVLFPGKKKARRRN